MAVHRNRVIYQSEALFISPDSTGYHFTGAHGEVTAEDGSKHSANWGLSTPPVDRHQVMGSQKNEAGQAAGWNCVDGMDAWPEWDAEETSGKKATFGPGGDMDNLSEDYTFRIDGKSNASMQAPTAPGTTIGQHAANLGFTITQGDPNLILDLGSLWQFDNSGVDHVPEVPAATAGGALGGLAFTSVNAGADNNAITVQINVGAAADAANESGALGDPANAPTITIELVAATPTEQDIVNLFNTLNGNNGSAFATVTTNNPTQTVAANSTITFANGADLVPEVQMEPSYWSGTLPVESKTGTATLVAKHAGLAGNVTLTGKVDGGGNELTLTALVADHNSTADELAKIDETKIVNGDQVVNEGTTIVLSGGEIPYAKAHGTIIQQLQRVQSANYGFTVNRQDINQFGHASRLDSIVVESPTVNLDFSYYLLDGRNERLLEFVTDGTTNTLSGLLTPELYQAGNNFFILTAPEARDAVKGDVSLNASTDAYGNSLETQKSVIALGNGYITDYSIDISVGSIPTASVTVEGMNIRSDFGTTGNDVPAVDMKNGSKISEAWDLDNDGVRSCSDNGCTGLYSLPAAVSGYTGCNTDGSEGSIAALRPGDVLVDLSSKSLISKSVAGNSDTPVVGSAHVQSASLSLPLGRTTLQRLGSVFGFSKAIDLPLATSMSFNALVADIKQGNMLDLLCDCEEFDIGITIFKPECAGCTVKDLSDPSKIAMRFTMKGARLESENFSSTIGDNKSVDLTFTTQIGSSDDMRNGLYIYGSESVTSANGGVPPSWTGLGGSTMDAIDGYLFGYRA